MLRTSASGDKGVEILAPRVGNSLERRGTETIGRRSWSLRAISRAASQTDPWLQVARRADVDLKVGVYSLVERAKVTDMVPTLSCMAEQLEGRLRFHDADMVTVADAARIAQRSVRTIRRAYLSGRLVAHRDANGRRLTIRYGDLRDWLLAEPITPLPDPPSADLEGRVEVRKPSAAPATTGNLELLAAARQRHARHARGSASARPYRGGTGSTSK